MVYLKPAAFYKPSDEHVGTAALGCPAEFPLPISDFA
jgi:hypothetical protein